LRVRIVPQVTGSGLPLRLAIALDVSGSMEGEKLQHAKAACEAVTGLLRKEDRLWLAGFSTGVAEILSSATGGSKACDRVRSAIASLQASGVTRTDLALEWIGRSLQAAHGASRVGLLITDGHATDPQGQALRDTELATLVGQAGTIGGGGITLCAVGMGDAAHFNTAFLADVTDRGRGSFVYARDPGALRSSLQDQLRSAQAVAVNDAAVTVKPLKSGVSLGTVCRFRPEFAALEASGDAASMRYAIGALASGAPTDVLVQVTTAALGFGERLGSHEVVEVAVEGGGAAASARAVIEWTNSLIAAQAMDGEVDKDRLMWEVNVYAGMLQRTADPLRTAEVLKAIADNASKAGQADVARRATADLDELLKKGVLPPDRRTGTMADVRKTGVMR
jgi:Ca-activated chloride channel family protein